MTNSPLDLTLSEVSDKEGVNIYSPAVVGCMLGNKWELLVLGG